MMSTQTYDEKEQDEQERVIEVIPKESKKESNQDRIIRILILQRNIAMYLAILFLLIIFIRCT